MNHLMLDIETLGNGPRAVIAAIGAVFFNPLTGELGESFYRVVDVADAAKYGEMDAGTIRWWMQQSDEARAIFNQNERYSLKKAIADFSDYIVVNAENIAKLAVWGNGCTLDNVIVSSAYSALKLQRPWFYSGDRDVRTVVDLGRTLLNFDPKTHMPFEGTVHNAVDDAIHQAKYVSEIYQRLHQLVPQSAEGEAA